MKLKQSTIAKELGITGGRVSQMKSKGMPTNSVDAARAWYSANVEQKFSPKLIPGIPVTDPEKLEEFIAEAYDIQRARAKREHHEANLSELRERQALGDLVEKARVVLGITSLAAQTRGAFERIPDKLADRLAAETDPQTCHALLTAEIDLILADLAQNARSLSFNEEDRGHR